MGPFGGNFETHFKAIKNLGSQAPPWTALAPFWGHFGFILGSCWGCLGSILKSFWGSKSVLEKRGSKKWKSCSRAGATPIFEVSRGLKNDEKSRKHRSKNVTKSLSKMKTTKKSQKSVYIDKESAQGGGRRLEGCLRGAGSVLEVCLGGAWSVLGGCLAGGPGG